MFNRWTRIENKPFNLMSTNVKPNLVACIRQLGHTETITAAENLEVLYVNCTAASCCEDASVQQALEGL